MNEMLEILGKNAVDAENILRNLSTNKKNQILRQAAEQLVKDTDKILAANAIDVQKGRENQMSEGLVDRLMLDAERIKGIGEGLRQVADLDDPIGEVLGMKKRPNGLLIGQKRVPLGVVGIIYEARPNVTADAFALCFKTGNAVILKGGSDAIHSNQAIVESIRKVLARNEVTEDAIALIQDTSRETASEFMKLNQYVDVLIPRGGKGLIQAVHVLDPACQLSCIFIPIVHSCNQQEHKLLPVYKLIGIAHKAGGRTILNDKEVINDVLVNLFNEIMELEEQEHDLEKCLSVCTSVKICCLLQCNWHAAPYKTMEHKHCHGHGKPYMHKDQSKSVVQQIQCSSVNAYQRDHNGLERNDHGGNHKGKNNSGQQIVIPYNKVCQHSSQYCNDCCCRYGNDQRILDGIQEIHLIKCFRKIIKGKAFHCKKPGKRTFNNISFLLQRIDHNHQKWKHISYKNKDHPCHCKGSY